MSITLPIDIGDTLLGGRFKNKSIKIKNLGVDSKGQPTVNGKPLLKNRIPKIVKLIKKQKENAKDNKIPFDEEALLNKIKKLYYNEKK